MNKTSEENKNGTDKWAKFDDIICSDDDDRPNYQKMELIEAFVKSIIERAIQTYLSEFPKGYRDTSEDGENRNKESEIELNHKFLADEANTANLSGLEQKKCQRKKQSPYEVSSSPDRAQKETNPLLSKTKPPEGSKLSVEEDVPDGRFRSCLLKVLCCCIDRQ
ncbi:hypothetical protein CHS0354_004609 [Potamilus streckersoni]|uniref:Uncharacterized protein n=1 Tax=Potamilus streckersoni TaxID=2493646 RepID=A0AAE0S4U5_9BIVA|nr:hypothetical protein CHS0354_004609 [Potamilus streckersoni]